MVPNYGLGGGREARGRKFLQTMYSLVTRIISCTICALIRASSLGILV